ncbi:hypothetical protein D3C76_1175510 [compost metagenome]
MQFTGFTFGDQGHGVGMVGQVFLEQAHVALPDKRHCQVSSKLQGVGFAQGRNVQSNRGRVDRVGPLPHQPHDHCVVAAVADAGSREGTIETHFDASHTGQLLALPQSLDEQCSGAHGPDRVRTGWADTDLEQVKHADGHCREPPE